MEPETEINTLINEILLLAQSGGKELPVKKILKVQTVNELKKRGYVVKEQNIEGIYYLIKW
jgi:hypothetical protein